MLKKVTTTLAALAMAGTATMAQAELKVGMITTLSGGGAGLGIDVRDGFLLAVKNSGRTDINVMVEDDARKPDVAKQIANKFVQKEKVDVLTGIIWSNLAMAVVPAATRGGTIYISPNAGPSPLAGKACHENYFNVAWQNDNLHEAMGGYVTGAGKKKPFIMAPNYPAGKDALTGFKRYYKGDLGGEVYTKLGQTDYAAEIAQIKASGADSLFFFLPGGMGISFMKQFAQSGMDIDVYGPAFSFDQGILKAVGEAALGVKNSSQWNKDIDNAANNKFVASFQAEYGRLPSLYASQGYDAANLIISASDKSGNQDDFRSALKMAHFDSVRGDFKFAANNHPIQDIYVREVVKEGDILTNKIIGVGLKDHSNAYVADCKM